MFMYSLLFAHGRDCKILHIGVFGWLMIDADVNLCYNW